jgi:hypothetical protein
VPRHRGGTQSGRGEQKKKQEESFHRSKRRERRRGERSEERIKPIPTGFALRVTRMLSASLSSFPSGVAAWTNEYGSEWPSFIRGHRSPTPVRFSFIDVPFTPSATCSRSANPKPDEANHRASGDGR